MFRLAIACFCAAFCVAASAQGSVMTNRAVYEQIHSHWKEAYPEEKILSIEDLRTVRSSSMGRHGSTEVKQAIVTVQRPGNPKARFRVNLQYRARMGASWQFEHAWVDRPAP